MYTLKRSNKCVQDADSSKKVYRNLLAERLRKQNGKIYDKLKSYKAVV